MVRNVVLQTGRWETGITLLSQIYSYNRSFAFNLVLKKCKVFQNTTYGVVDKIQSPSIWHR